MVAAFGDWHRYCSVERHVERSGGNPAGRKEDSMRRIAGVFAVVVLLMATAACTYHRAYIDYERDGDDIRMKAGGWEGERLGVVRASEGGPVWKDCTKVARASIWILMEETRAKGGNAIGEFRWVPAHPKHSSETPMCRQRWGWFLIWPAVLSHAFQSAGVEAVAYKLENPTSAKAGIYAIPTSEEDRRRLAVRIADESLSGG